MTSSVTPESDFSRLPVGESLTGWAAPEQLSGETLVGNWCRMERLDPEAHASSLFGAFAHDVEGRNWTYLPYGPFSGEDEYRSWIEEKSDCLDPLLLAIVPHNLGQAVGVAGYLRIKPEHGVLEIGHIHFSESLKRTPAATEAIYLMIREGFALGYRRCEWKCDSLNEASRRAANRFGFTFEGVFRKNVVYKERNRDTAWYSIVDADWQKLKPAFERWLAPSNFNGNGTQRERLSDLTRAALAED